MPLFLFAIHNARRIADTVPQDNLTATQHAIQAIQITFAIIALIAAAVYFWADRKDQKEIDEILRKHGIKKN
jgi:hypothetical protein